MTMHRRSSKYQTVSVDHLLALREHHASEIARIDTALSLVREAGRFAAKTDAVVGAVRARVAREPRATTTKRDPQFWKHALQRRGRELKKRGQRPIDLIERAFIDAGKTVLTPANILDLTKLAKTQTTTARRGAATVSANGKASRIIGLALAHLVRAKKIKASGDGFVAAPKLTRDISTANGARP